MGKLLKKHRWSFMLVLIGIIIMVSLNYASSDQMESKETVQPLDGGLGLLPLYWIVGIVGGCIALTLTYVSWKKYRAQRRRKN